MNANEVFIVLCLRRTQVIGEINIVLGLSIWGGEVFVTEQQPGVS